MRIATLVAIIFVSSNLPDIQDKKPLEDVIFERDVICGSAGEEKLKLNISRPKKTEGPLPCVVVIHGGAWKFGNREIHNDLTWNFAKRGYVSATLSYRFAPKHKFPAQIEDVKCAVRFLRANAEKYGIDPKKFGAIGFSAGAHLSMMLGVTEKEDGLEGKGGCEDQSSKVQAVVSYFGPTDLAAKDFFGISDNVRSFLTDLIGGTPEEKGDQFKKASPITFVSKGDAPTLMFHGTNDKIVPCSQTIVMADAMAKAGVPGRAELIIGADHGWKGQEQNRTMETTWKFFDDCLKADSKK